MLLPVIQPEILDGMLASGYDHKATLIHIAENNPHVIRFLAMLEDRAGAEAVAAVIMLYRMLEVQAEADELKELLA